MRLNGVINIISVLLNHNLQSGKLGYYSYVACKDHVLDVEWTGELFRSAHDCMQLKKIIWDFLWKIKSFQNFYGILWQTVDEYPYPSHQPNTLNATICNIKYCFTGEYTCIWF